VELTVVDNGISALDKARQVTPDIMLVDALMPGKNGYEVCEEVRRDPRLQNVPILLLTGAFEPFDEDKAKLCGADDFISKPFESQQLIEKIHKVRGAAKGRVATAAAAPIEVAPAAPVAPPIPVATVVSEAPLSAEEFAVFQDEPLAGAPQEAEAFAFAEEEIVEGTAEDDLWGAVELEEVSEAEEFALGEVVDDEEEAIAFTEAMEVTDLPVAEAVPVEELSGIDMSQFGEAEVDLEGAPDSFEESATGFAFSEPAGSASPVGEQVFAPEEEYVPAPELLATAAAVVPAPQAGAPATFSEEQLAAIVARISKDLIEKIAWEVVPDLAESIIKEEIRKIKGDN